jgi:hypothetical protein
MRKLLFPLFSLFVLAGLVLAACGTPVAATPRTVEVTRIVTSEAPAAAAKRRRLPRRRSRLLPLLAVSACKRS